jgi:amino acid adenylation domain-containing protein
MSLSEAERRMVLMDFNDTKVDRPRGQTVVDLFEAEVRRAPRARAIVAPDGRSLTFAELNELSNRLAHHLRQECSVGRDDVVNVAMESSERLIVCFLGVLKAGGAYMPIDPSYPRARIDGFLRESRAKVHLTIQEHASLFAGHEGRVIAVNEPWLESLLGPGHDPDKINDPDDLAYIIHTSGSTGKPKCILQVHRCLANFVDWQVSGAGIERGLRTLQFAALSFDVSVQEILFSLVSGGCLYLVTSAMRRDLDGIARIIEEEDIEIIDVPFSVLCALVNSERGLRRAAALRHIISAGEPLRLTHQLRELLEQRPELTLHNHYGPSETHMLASHSMNATRGTLTDLAPVGRPIWNMEAYILDESMDPVPIGGIGELYIGGVGLSRGYLDPELSRLKFVESPFKPGERLYRSEDLARWLPDGNIELVGRRDDQVKVRGHRIELGEIERAIAAYPQIEQAVVIAAALDDDHKELVAYLVTRAPVMVDRMRRFLGATLPEYMIPNHFVRLDALPLTPNCKVDKARLPPPGARRLRAEISREAPADDLEARLLAIWQEVLHVEDIDRHEDFFELGGDSLKAIRLVTQIARALEVDLGVRDLFEHPTGAGLTTVLRGRRRVASQRIPRVPASPRHALSPAQERLWLLAQTGPRASAAYNVTLFYSLDGEIDGRALRVALVTLVERHESLRTRFVEMEGRPWQIVDDATRIPLEEIDLREHASSAERAAELAAAQAARPIDLSRTPLLHATLYVLGPRDHRLLVLTHHIVSDAWSVRVLERELFTILSAVAEGRSARLAELPFQYKDYAAWQREAEGGRAMEAARDYWHRHLATLLPTPDLPSDRPRPAERRYRGAIHRFTLDRGLSERLQGTVRRRDTSLFTLLLAAVAALVHRSTAGSDIVLGSPVAGRDHPDLDGQIGFYVNTLPLRLEVRGDQGFDALVVQANGVVRDAIEHRAYPFNRIVEELSYELCRSRNPLFDASVALQSSEDAGLRFEGGRFTATREDLDVDLSMFDLSFQFAPAGAELLCKLGYDTDLFDPVTVELLAERLLLLLDQIASGVDLALDRIDLRTAAERELDRAAPPLEKFW